MTEPTKPQDKQPQDKEGSSSFADEAEQQSVGIVREFWDFLLHNKKWWLTPIILVLLLFGFVIIVGGGSVAAPFIYTLF